MKKLRELKNYYRDSNGVEIIALDFLKENGTIVYCTKDYRCGYPSCSEKQFFAPFYIEFQDGNAWILYATNSIRNDRMCIQQWHSEHIKVLFPSADIGRDSMETGEINDSSIVQRLYEFVCHDEDIRHSIERAFRRRGRDSNFNHHRRYLP